jgi:AcrR family transcriptional regulator
VNTARRSQRQTALLDRLVDLMAAEGFAGFTLEDLASRLRCSKSTLYQLAGSKQDLVVTVVRRYFASSVDFVESRVAAQTDPSARVQAYLGAVGEYLRPLSRQFLDDLASYRPASEVYRANTEAAARRIRELISEGIDSGAFRTVHAAFVAEVVAATMAEIQRGELGGRLGLTDSEAYAELASLVVSALT